MPSALLEQRLAQVSARRTATIARLRSLPASLLWAEPEDGWSAGQWLEHLVRTLRLQRRVLGLWVRLATPVARLRRGRSYSTAAENLFRTAPERVPGPFVGTRPKADRRHPVALERLLDEWDAETARLRVALRTLDDDTAGNLKVWDGPYGLVNLHQAIAHLADHEANDLDHIAAVLDALAPREAAGS